jgi:hypothetical protein
MNSLELNVVPGSTPIITQNLQDIDTENTPTVFKNKESTKTGVSGTPYSHQSKEKALNGQGTTICSDGSKYIGEFKDGKYHGQATFVLEIANSATMNMSASSVKESLKVKAFTQSPMGESMTVSGRTISTGQEMNTVKGGSWLEDILKGSDSR